MIYIIASSYSACWLRIVLPSSRSLQGPLSSRSCWCCAIVNFIKSSWPSFSLYTNSGNRCFKKSLMEKLLCRPRRWPSFFSLCQLGQQVFKKVLGLVVGWLFLAGCCLCSDLAQAGTCNKDFPSWCDCNLGKTPYRDAPPQAPIHRPCQLAWPPPVYPRGYQLHHSRAKLPPRAALLLLLDMVVLVLAWRSCGGHRLRRRRSFVYVSSTFLNEKFYRVFMHRYINLFEGELCIYVFMYILHKYVHLCT